MPRFFITGTDTGVGKTVASALLSTALGAIYWKPIQTGTREGTDSNAVMQMAEISRARTIPEAYRFAPPVSPHLAAKRAGVHIDAGKIRLPRIDRKESLIVEGAGGVLAPINSRQLMIDLMKRLGLPVLLVSRTSLGTINHTMLTIEALRGRKIKIAGIVINYALDQKSGAAEKTSPAAIEKMSNIRIMGIITYGSRRFDDLLDGILRKGSLR